MSDQSKLTYYTYCLTFELQNIYIDLYVNPVKMSADIVRKTNNVSVWIRPYQIGILLGVRVRNGFRVLNPIKKANAFVNFS